MDSRTDDQIPENKRHRLRNSLIAGAAAVVSATGGTAAWAIDRFLVEHVEIADGLL